MMKTPDHDVDAAPIVHAENRRDGETHDLHNMLVSVGNVSDTTARVVTLKADMTSAEIDTILPCQFAVGGHHFYVTSGCVFMKQSCSARENRFYEQIRTYQEAFVRAAMHSAEETVRRWALQNCGECATARTQPIETIASATLAANDSLLSRNRESEEPDMHTKLVILDTNSTPSLHTQADAATSSSAKQHCGVADEATRTENTHIKPTQARRHVDAQVSAVGEQKGSDAYSSDGQAQHNDNGNSSNNAATIDRIQGKASSRTDTTTSGTTDGKQTNVAINSAGSTNNPGSSSSSSSGNTAAKEQLKKAKRLVRKRQLTHHTHMLYEDVKSMTHTQRVQLAAMLWWTIINSCDVWKPPLGSYALQRTSSTSSTLNTSTTRGATPQRENSVTRITSPPPTTVVTADSTTAPTAGMAMGAEAGGSSIGAPFADAAAAAAVSDTTTAPTQNPSSNLRDAGVVRNTHNECNTHDYSNHNMDRMSNNTSFTAMSADGISNVSFNSGGKAKATCSNHQSSNSLSVKATLNLVPQNDLHASHAEHIAETGQTSVSARAGSDADALSTLIRVADRTAVDTSRHTPAAREKDDSKHGSATSVCAAPTTTDISVKANPHHNDDDKMSNDTDTKTAMMSSAVDATPNTVAGNAATLSMSRFDTAHANASILSSSLVHEVEKAEALRYIAPFVPRYYGVRRIEASLLAHLRGPAISTRGWYTSVQSQPSSADALRPSEDGEEVKETNTTNAAVPAVWEGVAVVESAGQNDDDRQPERTVGGDVNHHHAGDEHKGSLVGKETGKGKQVKEDNDKKKRTRRDDDRDSSSDDVHANVVLSAGKRTEDAHTGGKSSDAQVRKDRAHEQRDQQRQQAVYTSVSAAKSVVHAGSSSTQDQGTCQMLVMEDVCYGLKHPCVLDVKIGSRQYGLHPSPRKKLSKEQKALKSTSAKYGIRLAGYRWWNDALAKYESRTKLQCRHLTLAEIRDELHRFMRQSRTMEHRFRHQLENLRIAFSKQTVFRFFTSSLLFVYDADAPLYTSRVVMVDFAYTYDVAELANGNDPDAGFAYDVGYIKALDSLLSLLA